MIGLFRHFHLKNNKSLSWQPLTYSFPLLRLYERHITRWNNSNTKRKSLSISFFISSWNKLFDFRWMFYELFDFHGATGGFSVCGSAWKAALSADGIVSKHSYFPTVVLLIVPQMQHGDEPHYRIIIYYMIFGSPPALHFITTDLLQYSHILAVLWFVC